MTTPSDTIPGVPVGLATKVGLAAGAIGALVAAATAILNGDHSNETIAAGLFAAVNLYAVIRGRMDQAAARAGAAAQPVAVDLTPVSYGVAPSSGSSDYARAPITWETDEPELADEDLAGRDLAAEPVGHGDADLSDGDSHEEGTINA